MRHVLGAWALSVALLLAGALPAAAAERSDAPGVYFTSPSEGQTVAGTRTIEAYAVPDEGGLITGLLASEEIESITVTISPTTKGNQVDPITQSGAEFSSSWNTNSLTPHNGVYQLKADARTSQDRTYSATRSGIKVNNPPAAPTGVQAALTGEVPVVSWKANSEPDITGYKVYRAAASGAFDQVGSVKDTKFTDSKAPVGLPLRYQVVAVRYSPVSDGGVTAKSSSTSPVTIPAPESAEGGEGQPNELPEGVFIPDTSTAEPAPAPPPPPPPAPSAPLAPIIRSEPLAETGVDFDEQLPFGAPLPEQFDSSSGGSSSLNGARAAADTSGEGTLVSPMKFIATGLFLLVFSIILARTSRRLLKGKPGGEGSKPPKVPYPSFRISRS